MADNELKKLKRADLLEMLVNQSKENESLQQQLDEALNRLSQREIQINKAGSIADAALQLSGVFEAAQNAGAQYLENIERLSTEQEGICARITAVTKEKATQLLSATQQKCQTMESDTRDRCAQMLVSAERESKQYWETTSQKLETFYETHKGLRELLSLNVQKENKG